uniref:Uncharacterized protein n=1 Tax=Fagus sylvatica TaxID=28930 RepID=A0A2N9HT38_FAGSY
MSDSEPSIVSSALPVSSVSTLLPSALFALTILPLPFPTIPNVSLAPNAPLKPTLTVSLTPSLPLISALLALTPISPSSKPTTTVSTPAPPQSSSAPPASPPPQWRKPSLSHAPKPSGRSARLQSPRNAHARRWSIWSRWKSSSTTTNNNNNDKVWNNGNLKALESGTRVVNNNRVGGFPEEVKVEVDSRASNVNTTTQL